MRIIECEQRSPEWFEIRRGIPTASSFNKIVTSTGEPSKQRKDYLYTLAAERISGVVEETFVSLKMQKGIDREEEARLVYAMHREALVKKVGFCLSNNGRWGCSPDGLVDDSGGHGMIEIKCRMGKTAIEHLLANELPTGCVQQIQGGMFVTGTEWSDYVSYYPGLPLLIVRVTPDPFFMEKLKAELITFCDELDTICDKLKRRSG